MAFGGRFAFDAGMQSRSWLGSGGSSLVICVLPLRGACRVCGLRGVYTVIAFGGRFAFDARVRQTTCVGLRHGNPDEGSDAKGQEQGERSKHSGPIFV